MIEEKALSCPLASRYAGWESEEARHMLTGETLESIAARVEKNDVNPEPKSGRQELLENIVNRYV
jgi:xylose isomerase